MEGADPVWRGVLDSVPPELELLPLAEVEARSSRLAAEFPERVRLGIAGNSEEGRPIRTIEIGAGRRSILWVGVPHPNEPIGAVTLTFLARALAEDPALLASLDATVRIVPVADPDGLALNEGWLRPPFSLMRYALHYYRSPAVEQVEWGFPVPGAFESPPAETRALMTLIEAHRPERLVSLHNSSFSNVYFYATSHRPELFAAIRERVIEEGLSIHHGEPELPFLVPFEAGFYPTFGARELGAFGGIQTGTSSDEFLRSVVPGAESLVSELPYLSDPALADGRPSGESRRAAFLRGLARSKPLFADLERAWARVARHTPHDRLARAVRDVVERTPRRIAALEKRIDDPEYAREATVAEAFDAAVAKTVHPILQLGQARRLVVRAGEHELAAELEAKIRAAIQALEAESALTVLPLPKLVRVQAGACLLAMASRDS
jgi:hypothetical protein